MAFARLGGEGEGVAGRRSGVHPVSLKADGTCDRILRKWGITASALASSRISPPAIE
ncbi:hypothetical protein [Streptomyces sp. NPDC058770]|uniref:hypothetical protein n=1 Tax=unclassified Streptomyces TaxID=2593676 RepID=UPI0036C6F6F5